MSETPPESAPSAAATEARPRLARGVAIIREKLASLPASPGCYRMINATGDVLYVGKAKDLRKRVASYTQPQRQPIRIQRMIAETATLEIVTTHTEVEALLLEANLIKRLLPRYNVLLKDDKSFPYILIAEDHPAPQIVKHRGPRQRPGRYFGPFASAGAVNRTIIALQRAFLLRPCSDSVFANRSRPCLQYQIKRCSAPCVGRIGTEDYGHLVEEARDFLTGKSDAVKQRLSAEMQAAADSLEFERAATLRDRVQALAQIQSRQDINIEGVAEADIVALHQAGGQSCIEVFFFRNHGNYGNRAYFPSHERGAEGGEIMAAFLGQFYENKTPPPLILVSEMPSEAELLQAALSQRAGASVEILAPKRGEKRKPVDHALVNAREALARRLAEKSSAAKLLQNVAEIFGLDVPPRRIEVYDNSHISGRHAYGCMIVAGPEGFEKSQYRKFAIRHLVPTAETHAASENMATPAAPDPAFAAGDDYGMMREMLTRRFARALKEDAENLRATWPDLVLIDGGEGQLAVAESVMADLGIGDVALAAIAKGPDRHAGRERFFLPGRAPFSLDPKNPVLYYLQRLRDEAHRFAIGAHRAKRSAAIGQSPLDEISGIGAKRKKALLLHFGSARAVAAAGFADLCAVPGISAAVARRIYGHFHGG